MTWYDIRFIGPFVRTHRACPRSPTRLCAGGSRTTLERGEIVAWPRATAVEQAFTIAPTRRGFPRLLTST